MTKQNQAAQPNSRNDENISPNDIGGGPQSGVDGAPIDEDDDIADAQDEDDDEDDDAEGDTPVV